jgi:hypothetical protein
MWAARTGSSTTAGGVAIDASSNVFICGYSYNKIFYNANGTQGFLLPDAIGSTGGYIAKLNSDGNITTATAAASNVLVDATYLPSSMSTFVNGNGGPARAGTTLATTGLYLGGPSNYFNGSLSELIIYASTLTSGQRQQVEGYLAAKWGLRSSLISTQPYKILPPATSV